jgi:hypothetical protein
LQRERESVQSINGRKTCFNQVNNRFFHRLVAAFYGGEQEEGEGKLSCKEKSQKMFPKMGFESLLREIFREFSGIFMCLVGKVFSTI